MLRAPAERYIVGVERRGEVVHPGTHIGDLYHRISAELMLKPEVPLLSVGIFAISRVIDYVHTRRAVDVDVVYGRGKRPGCIQPVVVPQRPLTAQGDPIAGCICARSRAGEESGDTIEIRVVA